MSQRLALRDWHEDEDKQSLQKADTLTLLMIIECKTTQNKSGIRTTFPEVSARTNRILSVIPYCNIVSEHML